MLKSLVYVFTIFTVQDLCNLCKHNLLQNPISFYFFSVESSLRLFFNNLGSLTLKITAVFLYYVNSQFYGLLHIGRTCSYGRYFYIQLINYVDILLHPLNQTYAQVYSVKFRSKNIFYLFFYFLSLPWPQHGESVSVRLTHFVIYAGVLQCQVKE